MGWYQGDNQGESRFTYGGGPQRPDGWSGASQMGFNALNDAIWNRDQSLDLPEYAGISQQGMNALRQGQNPGFLGAAQSYYDELMGGQTNPYLDAQFNKAADAVRQRIDSQFAAAGRYGSDAQKNVMSDAYNDLANQMYGGQYQSDQARRMQALGMAGNLAEQSYMIPYKAAALEQAQQQQANSYDYDTAMQMINDWFQGMSGFQSAKGSKAQADAMQRQSNQGMANLGTGLQILGTAGGLGWQPLK